MCLSAAVSSTSKCLHIFSSSRTMSPSTCTRWWQLFERASWFHKQGPLSPCPPKHNASVTSPRFMKQHAVFQRQQETKKAERWECTPVSSSTPLSWMITFYHVRRIHLWVLLKVSACSCVISHVINQTFIQCNDNSSRTEVSQSSSDPP